VQSALRSVPGVESAKVDFDAKTATVTCKGSCDSKAMVAALQKAGFDGKVK
jgi:copper chaperone CopZ